jgi:RNA polymerase sigma-B factor
VTRSTLNLNHQTHSDEAAARSVRNQELVTVLRQATAASERERLRHQLIEENIAVADAIAARYTSRGIATEDLQQVARLALVRASHAFRPELEQDFLAYAVPCMRGELRRHFRDAGWVVRPPRRVQEAQYQLRSVRLTLAEKLGREATVAELAHEADLDLATVTEALSLAGCFNPESLDRPVNAHDSGPLTIGDRLSVAESEYERSEARIMLQPLVAELAPRDAQILQLRFCDGLTQREVGAAVGVTQMQVSRILTRVLAALREQLEPSCRAA